MKIQTRTKMSMGLRFAKLAAAGALLVSPAQLFAGPDEDAGAEGAEKELAEKIREDLMKNQGALGDMIRRAMENGGKLELDNEEFQKLMEEGKGELPGNAGAEMADFLRKLLEDGGRSRVLTPEEAEKLFGAAGRGDGAEEPQDGDAGEPQDGDAAEPQDGDGEPQDGAARGNALKGFMDLFQRQMRGRRAGENEKETRSVLMEYVPVIRQARRSTVSLVAGRKQLALGTVVDSDGYIITKASEVAGKELRCVFPGGVHVSATVVDTYEPLDLALVKVEAEGLVAARWSGKDEVELGSFLAAPGIDEEPIAIGVASVASRSLSEKTKGFLGVTPEGGEDGVRIARVLEGTPAAKAGLLVGDVVLELDGEVITNRAEFHRMVAGRRPAEDVVFKVRRGEEEKTLTATLVSREEFASQNGGDGGGDQRSDRMNTMGGDLSENRSGYTAAMQTDLTLDPEQCGGPLVDLDGKIVGVNIARGGRVKSYAVPVKELKALLGDVKSGKFTTVDLSELKRAAEVAEAAMQKAEEAMKAAREAKEAADQALKAASGE